MRGWITLFSSIIFISVFIAAQIIQYQKAPIKSSLSSKTEFLRPMFVSKTFGFSFNYPESYALEKRDESYFRLQSREDRKSVIIGQILPGGLPYHVASTIQPICSNYSFRCLSIATQRVITNIQGITGNEYMVSAVATSSGTSQPPVTTIGPVYIFSLLGSPPSQLILYAEGFAPVEKAERGAMDKIITSLEVDQEMTTTPQVSSASAE